MYNEAEDTLTIFAVNRHLEESLELDCDIRGFEGYRLIEHLVLEHEDLKAVNTADREDVKPHAAGSATCDDGYVKARLVKASWNVIRLGKPRN